MFFVLNFINEIRILNLLNGSKMVDDKNLRAMILIAEGMGVLERYESHALLSALPGTPILVPVPSDADKALGKSCLYENLDTERNDLVAGENYLL